MGMKRVLTKESRVRQITSSAERLEIDATVQMGLKNLQQQLQAVYQMLADVRKGSAGSWQAGRVSPTLVSLENLSGAGRGYGEVVVRREGAREGFDVTSRECDTRVIGVVYSDSPDGDSAAVPEGGSGLICVTGQVRVLVDADCEPVLAGDPLVTGETPGLAVKAPHAASPGVFATAMAGRASGIGLVPALVHGVPEVYSRRIAEHEVFDRSLFKRAGCMVPQYDETGAVTGFSGALAGAVLWDGPGMSQLVGRWTFGYAPSGGLATAIHSVYDPSGEGVLTVNKTIEMQLDRVSRIIAELM